MAVGRVNSNIKNSMADFPISIGSKKEANKWNIDANIQFYVEDSDSIIRCSGRDIYINKINNLQTPLRQILASNSSFIPTNQNLRVNLDKVYIYDDYSGVLKRCDLNLLNFETNFIPASLLFGGGNKASISFDESGNIFLTGAGKIKKFSNEGVFLSEISHPFTANTRNGMVRNGVYYGVSPTAAFALNLSTNKLIGSIATDGNPHLDIGYYEDYIYILSSNHSGDEIKLQKLLASNLSVVFTKYYNNVADISDRILFYKNLILLISFDIHTINIDTGETELKLTMGRRNNSVTSKISQVQANGVDLLQGQSIVKILFGIDALASVDILSLHLN